MKSITLKYLPIISDDHKTRNAIVAYVVCGYSVILVAGLAINANRTIIHIGEYIYLGITLILIVDLMINISIRNRKDGNK